MHPWILRLPRVSFTERNVRMAKTTAIALARLSRGIPVEDPSSGWSRDETSKFGEDLVGGWLLKNGGLIEGLRKEDEVIIPDGGNQTRRRADWLLGQRIIVEVKTYLGRLTKGGRLKNTRQIEDYARWRDERPEWRAVVLARVAFKGNSMIEPLFRQDLEHYHVPVIFFLW